MKCSDVYKVFFKPGEVCEIRAYGLKKSNPAWEGWAVGMGIVYGYFDNAEAFGMAAESLERAKAPGIYFTLNPVVPDLLARAVNRLKAADMKSSSTSDPDIACIRWLPIDLDPKRPAGISSTDAELAAAVELREKIVEWAMKYYKWAPRLRAHSGNGVHLLYRLEDFPNGTEIVEIVKETLVALAGQFTNDAVEVDLKVFNPSRIWKLYGTTARKGDHTELRPHRKSYMERKEALRHDKE